MNFMRKQYFIWLLISLSYLAVCFLIVNEQISRSQTYIHKTINTCLKESITKDFLERTSSCSTLNNGDAPKKVKDVTIMADRGKRVKITFKDSLDYHIANYLISQFILSKSIPINPDNFNSIFSQMLRENSLITEKTGIVYSYNKKFKYSNNDSISPLKAYCTALVLLDIQKTVGVKAWVIYPWTTIVKNVNFKIIWPLLFCLPIFFPLFYFYYGKKTVVNTEKYIQVANIRLDETKKRLYIDGELCKIKIMDFNLLKLFLEAPDFFLTRETIKTYFWPTDINSDDKINAHILAIRRVLKEYPQINLITEKKKGYQLQILS